jgi:predicted metalloprotease
MKYGEGDRESENVEDRRGMGGGGFPGGGIPIPIGGGGLSLTGLIVVGIICLMLGINPLELLSETGGMPNLPQSDPRQIERRSPGEIPGMPGQRRVEAGTDEMATFVRRVLADTEDTWTKVFAAAGRRYEPPTLVLFTRATRTACGTGVSAMGPFYCPLDAKVYIDLAFYDELKRRFQAQGDFAQAYVIAHEVAHHVQKLQGVADAVQRRKQQAGSEAAANALQVRMELQADCLAGVWASLNDQVKRRLEAGDIEEGLNAAAQIGDDTLQRRTQGHVVPEAFTHGTSAQRVRWFKRGLETGQPQACDTFTAREL